MLKFPTLEIHFKRYQIVTNLVLFSVLDEELAEKLQSIPFETLPKTV